jgi:citrate synthase
MGKSPFLTSREAAGELGVSQATLYAYVSRGLVRSEAVAGNPRDRRYHAEDIQRLKQRKELRRNLSNTTGQALNWGVPVLESGLTLISDGRLFYRGQDAAHLALNSSLEGVASLLWTGEVDSVPLGRAIASSPQPANPQPSNQKSSSLSAGHAKWLQGETFNLQLATFNYNGEHLTGIHAFQAGLIQAESQDPAAFDLRPESVARKGFSILHLLAGIAAKKKPGRGDEIARILQAGWVPNRPDAARLISAALVLCADHELNVSAFTARCVASAGSSPYAVVLAGLAALQGAKHGGITRQVKALFHEVGSPDRAQAVLSSRLQRGELIPGFGLPLYPEGDPRARLLLELLQDAAAPAEWELAEAIAGQALRLTGDLPTVDFALVSLASGLELPGDAALMIFAIGRTVGWIAHAIEQYRAASLIRPRARYTGPQP